MRGERRRGGRGGGGGGADEALTTMCFSYRRKRALDYGGRTSGSQTPGVPATWASTSAWTEAAKMSQTAAKIPLRRTQRTLSIHRHH